MLYSRDLAPPSGGWVIRLLVYLKKQCVFIMLENDEKQKSNLASARKERGQTTAEDDRKFAALANSDLIRLLHDDGAQTRTSAAKILGNRLCLPAIDPLCNQLCLETALYPKIAISDALGKIGEPALPALIKLIGKIGNNQHLQLPTDIFKKWSYPLPRDIAVRTIIKAGPSALQYLNALLDAKNNSVLAEVIDAIGYISFYSHDCSSFPRLMCLLNTEDDIIKWKLLRACGAFPLKEAENVLREYLRENSIPALRWEAARSLALISTQNCREILKEAREKESNDLVKKMVDFCLAKLEKA